MRGLQHLRKYGQLRSADQMHSESDDIGRMAQRLASGSTHIVAREEIAPDRRRRTGRAGMRRDPVARRTKQAGGRRARRDCPDWQTGRVCVTTAFINCRKAWTPLCFCPARCRQTISPSSAPIRSRWLPGPGGEATVSVRPTSSRSTSETFASCLQTTSWTGRPQSSRRRSLSSMMMIISTRPARSRNL